MIVLYSDEVGDVDVDNDVSISIVSFVEYDIFSLYLNLEYESTDDESIPEDILLKVHEGKG